VYLVARRHERRDVSDMPPNPPEIEAMVQLFDAGRFEDALARVEPFLASQPAVSMAWRFKAECLAKLARYAEAIPCFTKAEELGGRGGADAALLKATAEWNAGRWADARATLERVVANEGGRFAEDVVERASQLRSIMANKATGET
jgi:tetratricopeptide (TPR) repeat protein